MPLTFVVGEPEAGSSMGSNLSIGIVGGGFAGLYTVFFLRKFFPQEIDLTLFDKNNYFLYTPVLHEMATGTVNARHVVIPIRKVVDARDVHIRCEEVNRGRSPFQKRWPSFTINRISSCPGSKVCCSKYSA